MLKIFFLLIGFQVLIGILFTKVALITDQSGWADPAIVLWMISILGTIFWQRKKFPGWKLILLALISPFISFFLYEIVGIVFFGWLGGR
jgi:hypothetical protein